MDHPFLLEHRAESYSRVHGILLERRGSAKNYLCACGQPADQWAYQHSAGEDERVDAKGHPYSLNLLDYEPMCSTCHWELDLPHKKQTAGDAVRADKRKRRCSCGWEMAVRSIAIHQRSSGCVGWEDV